MKWSEGVWDSEKRNTNCSRKKMAIKQESVKLSISDNCNGHDGDVEIKNNHDDDDYDDDDDDDDVDVDDDKLITISKLHKSKPACQLLSGLMS